MEAWAPTSWAETYDNVGLLVGDAAQPIQKILVALDLTDAVINEAIAGKYNCIVTHHPIMRDPVRRVNTDTLEGKKIFTLIQHGISLYTAHTNLDKAPGGVNHCLAEKVGLFRTKPLVPQTFDMGRDLDGIVKRSDHTQMVADGEVGFGRVGEIPQETTLAAFADMVKSALGLDSIRYIGDGGAKIKKVALCGGSGMSYLNEAKNSGCDVYITGDIRHHDGVTALEHGLPLIDATHYGSEAVVVEAIVARLQRKAVEDGLSLDIEKSQVDGHVFYAL